MAGLDGAGLCCVEHLQRRDDLVGGEDLDLELPFRQLADAVEVVLVGASQKARGLDFTLVGMAAPVPKAEMPVRERAPRKRAR